LTPAAPRAAKLYIWQFAFLVASPLRTALFRRIGTIWRDRIKRITNFPSLLSRCTLVLPLVLPPVSTCIAAISLSFDFLTSSLTHFFLLSYLKLKLKPNPSVLRFFSAICYLLILLFFRQLCELRLQH
jgi:hypothetical protein